MENFTHAYRHTEPLHTQTRIQYQQVKVYWSMVYSYLYYLFIYLLNYLCFTFIGVPQVYSRVWEGWNLITRSGL